MLSFHFLFLTIQYNGKSYQVKIIPRHKAQSTRLLVSRMKQVMIAELYYESLYASKRLC